MIGIWQKFGEGEPPKDGEAVVVIYPAYPGFSRMVGDEPSGKLVPCIYRYGSLLDQDGGMQPTPFGCYWTSLPRNK